MVITILCESIDTGSIPVSHPRKEYMRVLYRRTYAEVPEGFVPSEVQRDILDNWKPNYNLFSITQLADRNNKSRDHVQRKVRQLIKLGLVEKYKGVVQSGLE